MNGKTGFPVIFGRVAVSGVLPVENPIPDVEEIFRVPESLVIYQAGASPEIHKCRDGRGFTTLVGRVYNPVQINHIGGRSEEKLFFLSNIDLERIEGSFVYLKMILSHGRVNLYLSTDKYGFRRILYFQDENTLTFATHLLGLKLLLQNRLTCISAEALLHYYNFGFTPNDQTLLEGIRKVPPGSTLKVENGNVSIFSYFSVSKLYCPHRYAQCSEEDICKIIDDRLLKSICRRIPGAGLVGVSLSGGVDSGYIAQKVIQSGAPVVGYTLAYDGYYDEFDRVDSLSKPLGIEVRKITVTPDQVIENFKYANSISSEPMGFNNSIMRFVALEAQKDGVQTLFDGDGTDRLFLGMSRYLQYQKAVWIYNLSKKIGLLPLLKSILRLIPSREFHKLHIHFQNWSRGICPYPERDLGSLQKYDALYECKVYESAVKRFRDSFERELGFDDFGLYLTYQAIQMCPEMFFYDPSEIQAELGLFPVPGFWDDTLVSLAISLPTESKLRGGNTKHILRLAAARNLLAGHWMLPKIGLQNSFAYVIQSREGRKWQTKEREKVMNSEEYEMLRRILPGGNVELDKFIALIVWKERNAIA